MTCIVRRLGPSDAGAFRAIRQEALLLYPEAFGADADTEAAMSDADVAERLTRNAVFGVFDETLLAGLAGFFVFEGAKVAHKGYIWGVYLRPEVRGSGAADALMTTVLSHASERVEQVQLGVATDNATARRLYERHGFVEYGLERRAYKVAGRYIDDALMVKAFDDDQSATARPE